jgi:hypothetical protein
VTFRLGRKPKRTDPRTLQLRKYIPAIPVPPASSTWYRKVGSKWGMDGNDTLGDCTIAAAAHMILDWTANANPPATQPSEAEIEAAYNVVDGGVDQGADMLTVLNYWRKTGIGSHKISAFVQVESRNHLEVMEAVDLFGAVYLGVSLPDYCVSGDMLLTPWDLPVAEMSYPPGDPANGHCIPIVGYDPTWLYVVTWGEVKKMAWGFMDAYADEAFAVVAPDWLSPAGESPPGFNMAQLVADLTAITQSPPPSPPPPPAPSIWARILAWIEATFHIGTVPY